MAISYMFVVCDYLIDKPALVALSEMGPTSD